MRNNNHETMIDPETRLIRASSRRRVVGKTTPTRDRVRF
jgi:hypothetical protein